MNYINCKRRIIFPLTHIVLSFFWERLIILYHEDIDIVAAIPLNNIVSDNVERIIGYCVSKLIACVLIMLVWNLFFYVISGVKCHVTIRVASLIFIIGTIILLFLWPETFLRSADDLITYSYAIRLWPEYWHSAYSSFLYCSCLMVFPHPIAISLFQWLFGVYIIGYLSIRIENSKKIDSKFKWVPFALFLVPGSFVLLTDSYRTEQYALLCIFYSSLVGMDIIDERKRSNCEIILLAILSAIIAVWRSEGVILGGLGFISLIVFVYKPNMKKGLILLVSFICFFIFISVPQKLGIMKYYGSDYTFVNSFPTLQNIFNSYNSNLAYKGAEDDLESISDVVGVGYICVMGLDGYRRSNYDHGLKDINQSGVTKEVANAYKSAYYRLVLHNVPIYLKTQVSMLTNSIGVTKFVYMEPLKTEWGAYLPDWEYDAWDIGFNDYMSYSNISAWYNNGIRKDVSNFILKTRNKTYNILFSFYIVSLLFFMVILIQLAVVIYGLKQFVSKRELSPFAVFAIILLGQLAAIILVMPAPMITYFHATIYSMLIFDVLYLLQSFGLEGLINE